MKHEIQLFDAVALNEDLPEQNLRRGEVGTVVDLLSEGRYEVEFGDECQAYATLPLRADQLVVLPKRRKALDVEHFATLDPPNIHLFLEKADSDRVEMLLEKAARELGYHFAVLDGTKIDGETSLLAAVAHSYEFPYGPEGWDGSRDWMGDFSWIVDNPEAPSKVKGFLLYYKEPMPLFLAAAVEFAFFLDMFCDAVDALAQDGLPYHLVIGPVSYEANLFMNVLKCEDRICRSCFQSLAGVRVTRG